VVEDEGSSGSLADLFEALLAPMTVGFGWGPRVAMEMLFEHLRARLVGRRVDVETSSGPLAFTVCELRARIDSIAAAAGQADEVSLSVRNVEFSGLDFAEVTAALGNVHTRIGTRPTVVCAPIDLRVDLTNEQVSRLLQRFSSRIVASCMETGRVRLRWCRAPAAGWIDVLPELVRDQLVLRPVALGRKRWSLGFGRRIPARSAPVKLPARARVTGVDVRQAAVSVDIHMDQWQVDYSRILGLGR
jgi:hypothetical protein